MTITLLESAVEDQVEMVVAVVKAAKVVVMCIYSCAAVHILVAQQAGHQMSYELVLDDGC